MQWMDEICPNGWFYSEVKLPPWQSLSDVFQKHGVLNRRGILSPERRRTYSYYSIHVTVLLSSYICAGLCYCPVHRCVNSNLVNMLASVGIPVDCLHKRVGQHPTKSAATGKSVARDIIFNVCEYTFTDPIISQKVSVSANIFLSSNHKIPGNQNQEVTISVFNCWRL